MVAVSVHPGWHQALVLLRSLLFGALLLGGYPALRWYFVLSDVKCPNITTSYPDILPPSGPAAPLPGTLVLAGGGRLPDTVFDAFLHAAGGVDARLVVIPTAGDMTSPDAVARLKAPWLKRGVVQVSVLHSNFRSEANDPAFVAPLTQATAVWLRGGDQKRLLDAYKNTRVESELLRLLERNGVIGGTSAGAVIMGRVMVLRSHDADHLAEGFGLAPNVIIDTHFLKRNRLDRLQLVLLRYPGRVGLGIDEGTAAIIQGDTIRVVGNSVAILCQSASARRPASFQVLNPAGSDHLIAQTKEALQRMHEGRALSPEATEVAAALQRNSLPPKLDR